MWMIGFACGVVAALAVYGMAYNVKEDMCTRKHNVYQCERIVQWVPKEQPPKVD